MNNTAIAIEHRHESADIIFLTRWFDSYQEAEVQCQKYRAMGAYFDASRPDGVLGKFRAIGHFRKP